ncbi:MAG: hypothetical protein O6945_16095 [Gammaproteobacteria bacterium]|nr:hypothetical protein [Gammaproteobacteria bacterium]
MHYGLPDGLSVTEAIERFSLFPIVKYVELNLISKEYSIPSDPLYAEQWYLTNTGHDVNARNGPVDIDIDWDLAVDIYSGTEAIVVVVIDSGVALNHPEISPNLWVNTDEIAIITDAEPGAWGQGSSSTPLPRSVQALFTLADLAKNTSIETWADARAGSETYKISQS